MPVSDAALKRIRVHGLPVRLFLESQDHQHDLIRELQLIDIGGKLDEATAARATDLVARLRSILARYQAVRTATRAQALAALDRGDNTVTIELSADPVMAEALEQWIEVVEAADELCRQGDLLLLAARPEIRDLRRWYVDTITTQLKRESEH